MAKLFITHSVISSGSNIKNIIDRIHLVTCNAFFIVYEARIKSMDNIAILNKFKCSTSPRVCIRPSRSCTKTLVWSWFETYAIFLKYFFMMQFEQIKIFTYGDNNDGGICPFIIKIFHPNASELFDIRLLNICFLNLDQ